MNMNNPPPVLPPNMNDPLRSGATAGAALPLPRLIRQGAIGLAIAGVAAIGIILVSGGGNTPASPEDVPLITADNAPLRERPAEEGGMQVPNRDTTLFSQLDAPARHGTLEQLIPPPESPMDGPALDPAAPSMSLEPRRPDGSPALTNDEIRQLHLQRRAMQKGDAGEQAMQTLQEVASSLPPGASQGQLSTLKPERLEPAPAPAAVASAPETVSAPMPAPVDVATRTAKPAPLPKDGEVASKPAAAPAGTVAKAGAGETEQLLSTPESAAVAAKNIAAAKPAAPKTIESLTTITAQEEKAVASVAPAAGGTRMIQLGAVRTEAAAQAEWKRLQAKYRQLSGLDGSVQQADLGARGIYWRVRGGPVTEAQGKDICKALEAAKQTCMVVGK